MTKNLTYRPNAGICLMNSDKKIFIAQRTGFNGNEGWQMPQGGINAGEQPIIGMNRELREETKLDGGHWQYLGQYPTTIRYDFPPEIQAEQNSLGQEQTWFYLLLTADDSVIDVINAETPEFQQWRWATAEEVQALCVDFKTEVYQHVLTYLQNDILPNIKQKPFFKNLFEL